MDISEHNVIRIHDSGNIRILRSFSVDEILPLIVDGGQRSAVFETNYGKFRAPTYTQKLRCYKEKGINCKCGLLANLFLLETDSQQRAIICLHGRDMPRAKLTAYNYSNGVLTPMTCDHILAQALGGTNDIDNLSTLCYPCNQAKSKTEYRLARDLQANLKYRANY